ncbi:Peroxisomal acyl-coenzyme A thioester hydrolase 1 [Candida viswanathii]|uniref:Peroxisomal acyl-coenzyme A thioester hydrolase 1 n=1 Tax=Candida viswanathii TaxID=5486 RepID=A0A367XMT6_9ASCO|nr:Peroxisomal acyl-coenzyme A thioester hydrolase 1 [Candida viswanathii]
MDKLQAEVYEAEPPVAKLEAKTAAKLISSDGAKLTYEGVYPVELVRKGLRGTYGGDFIAQGINVAWESIGNKTDFQPHSLHAYFVKAGSDLSVLRWEVLKVSDSRNFANRLMLAYQTHTNELVFTMQISFTKDNNEEIKRAEYKQLLQSGGKIRSIPFAIKKPPNEKYFKLKDKVDDLPYFEHTNGNMATAIPPDFLEYATEMNHDTVGNKEFGIFMKVLDDYSLGKNYERQSFLGLAFLSDAVWLSSFTPALGLPLGTLERKFFRVSLDHTMYFHDANFDSSEWIFVDFRFVNLNNNRLLGVVNFYTLQGKLVATVIQEAYMFLHQAIIDKSQEIAEKSGHKKQVITPKL